jgi:hypothetical protein
MTFGPQPPGEAEANAHSLIRLRERTENPQLTDVPSDLRVNGARHASRDLELPSKPNSPPRLRSIQGTPLRRSGRPRNAVKAFRQTARRTLPGAPDHCTAGPLRPLPGWPVFAPPMRLLVFLCTGPHGASVRGSAGTGPDCRYSGRETGG